MNTQCVKNNDYPLRTDLGSLKSSSYVVHSDGHFKSFVEACFYVASISTINTRDKHGDVLVIEAHGLEDGGLLVGGRNAVEIDNVVKMCDDTNIRTIILASCFGDRAMQRLRVETDVTIIYSIGEIYDADAMLAVKRMVESLEFWPIEKVLRMINNGTYANRWLIA